MFSYKCENQSSWFLGAQIIPTVASHKDTTGNWYSSPTHPAFHKAPSLPGKPTPSPQISFNKSALNCTDQYLYSLQQCLLIKPPLKSRTSQIWQARIGKEAYVREVGSLHLVPLGMLFPEQPLRKKHNVGHGAFRDKSVSSWGAGA